MPCIIQNKMDGVGLPAIQYKLKNENRGSVCYNYVVLQAVVVAIAFI
jgi:hypothetical protein